MELGPGTDLGFYNSTFFAGVEAASYSHGHIFVLLQISIVLLHIYINVHIVLQTQRWVNIADNKIYIVQMVLHLTL